jgi:hypothetical protein
MYLEKRANLIKIFIKSILDTEYMFSMDSESTIFD